MTSQIVIPYTPRPHAQKLHRLIEQYRHVVTVWHRRAGKTVAAVNAGIKVAIKCALPNPMVLYVAPFRNQAKRVAWKYFKDFTATIPGARPNETELLIRLPNAATIMLGGADSPDTYRGQYFDYVICDEVAQFPPRLVTEIIRPAIADRRGSMLFIGTPKGRNNFYKLYQQAGELPEWSRDFLPVADTDVLHPDELAAIRREMPRNEYEQEFDLSWTAAITGAIYGAEMSEAERAGRITSVPHDPALSVYSAFDLGIRDSSVWLYQLLGMEVRMLECRNYTGSSLVEILTDLRTLPYTFAAPVVPHDARLREYSTGVTRIQTMQNLGFNPTVCRMISVEDGIEATRNFLSRTWFDAAKCAEGIEALIQYRTEYDDVKQVYSLKPLHDWCSHPADAMRMAAVEHSGGQPSFDFSGTRLPWEKAGQRGERGAYQRGA